MRSGLPSEHCRTLALVKALCQALSQACRTWNCFWLEEQASVCCVTSSLPLPPPALPHAWPKASQELMGSPNEKPRLSKVGAYPVSIQRLGQLPDFSPSRLRRPVGMLLGLYR